MNTYLPVAALAPAGASRLDLALAWVDEAPRTIALKRIRLGGTPQDRAEWERTLVSEALITARLHHANIVGVLEIGTHQGETAVAHEYIEGATLEQLIARAGRCGTALPESVCLRIMSDVLDGLQHAHASLPIAGRRWPILHRDVSPANILIGLDGRARILDFRPKWTLPVSPIGTNAVHGTFRYLAPEQLSGRNVDVRTDLFACGAVLEEALYGQGQRRLRKDLDDVLNRCLEQDPARRFSSAQNLQRALWECARTGYGLATASTVAAFAENTIGAVIKARRRLVAQALHEMAPDPTPALPRTQRPVGTGWRVAAALSTIAGLF